MYSRKYHWKEESDPAPKIETLEDFHDHPRVWVMVCFNFPLSDGTSNRDILMEWFPLPSQEAAIIHLEESFP